MASYTIRAVAERTGLSQHTIRAWERRYGALEPDRTGTNRRTYTEADIQRLQQLKKGIGAGHSIGMIARLDSDELQRITVDRPAIPADNLLQPCLTAVKDLDAVALDMALSRAFTTLGLDGFIDKVVIPLIGEIDRGWQTGEFGISQEHLTSSLLRTHLERIRLSMPSSPNAPRLLTTSPVGQLHELGALIAAIRATQQGWQVLYLGPNTPAEEIARAATASNSQAVALSIVYPEADPVLELELRALRSSLGSKLPILVGGRAATSYKKVLDEIGAVQESDCGGLSGCLDRI